MTLQNDTLVCDTVQLAYWKSNPAYDYNRELMFPEVDIIGWLSMQFEKLLRAVFGSRFAEAYGDYVLIALFVIIVCLLVWFLYKKRPELFMRAGKGSVAYAVHEDSIYGVDFQTEIDAALSRSDYKEAVRLLYLQTLKQLSDNEVIDWQPHKTATDYIYEVKPDDRRESLRRLTNHFLRVRYGNFEANERLFYSMKTWQGEVKKGGAV